MNKPESAGGWGIKRFNLDELYVRFFRLAERRIAEKTDPSVFSTEYNKAGIGVGTAISFLVRKEERDEKPTVHYREFWRTRKRVELLESLTADETREVSAMTRRLTALLLLSKELKANYLNCKSAASRW